MKKTAIVLGSILITSLMYGQGGGVGVSDTGVAPDNSAMLDVKSLSKGVLIPRLALTSTTDATTITNGNVNSLLVYNTATVSDVVPGYYYWDATANVWKTLGGDADSDPINEIQDLQLTGNILTITNNGSATTIDLSSYLDNTDAQNLASTAIGGNATVNISNGTGTTFSINDADSDPTNEIELPTGGTLGQVLSTNGTGVYSWITDNSGSDIQNIDSLVLIGNMLTVFIENGNSSSIDLTPVLEKKVLTIVGSKTSTVSSTFNISNVVANTLVNGNPSISSFIIPSSGVYALSLNTTICVGGGTNTYFGNSILINSIVVASGTGHAHECGGASTTIYMPLSAGDVVSGKSSSNQAGRLQGSMFSIVKL